MGRAIKNSRDSSILIEPLAERNLEEVAELYFRIGPFLKFSSARIVEEYLRRNIESKSYLRGYVIKKNGKLVGSSLIVKWDEKVGALLFTVTDESFAGFERLLWLGRAYRETIKALVAKGIAKVQSSTPMKNPTAIKYSLATGYIKYAESNETAHFETYLPLLASTVSMLSGVGFDDISLLQLASIAANPKKTNDTSYEFDFDFKRTRYVLKVDKLGNGVEAISCPDFSVGFGYPKPYGWTNRKLKAHLELSNSTDHVEEFKFTVTVNDDGSQRTVCREKRVVGPGESFHCPLKFDFEEAGTKTLSAEIAAGRKKYVLSKAFVIHQPLAVGPDFAKIPADELALKIKNTTARKARVIITSEQQNRNGFREELSLAGGAIESIAIPIRELASQKGKDADIRVRSGHEEAVADINISADGNLIYFREGGNHAFTNKSIVVGINADSGIMYFRDAVDPKFVVFQLPEELGPPFTEYGNNQFQSKPISYRPAGISTGGLPGRTKKIPLKPKFSLRNGVFMIKYILSGNKDISIEKRILFKEQNLIEIRPKAINRSGHDIDSKIVFRTCLKIMTNTSIRVPIYKNSLPAKSVLSENPYRINELLLEGHKIDENWSAFEFVGSEKCVGHIWQGDPEYDFFPLWFNKMPWLIYDTCLGTGEEMVFPAHQIAFKNESWKAVRSASEKMRLVGDNSTTRGGAR